MLNKQTTMRVARPTKDLASAERFWVDGVGLEVLWRTDDTATGGHSLLMVGVPGAGWHLELVDDPESAAASTPSEEDLLVIYLGEPPTPEQLDRVSDAGGRRTKSRNPYWDQWGITFADPDGNLVNLCSRTWAA